MKRLLLVLSMLAGLAYGQPVQPIGDKNGIVRVLGRFGVDTVLYDLNPGDTVLFIAPDGTMRKYKTPGMPGDPSSDSTRIYGFVICNWNGGVPVCVDLDHRDTVKYKYPMHVISKGSSGSAYDSIEIIGSATPGQVLTVGTGQSVSWQNAAGTGGAPAWLLTGNAGTTPSTNFIGTTDNADVIFKRFNIRGGFISKLNTSFGDSAFNPASTGANNAAFGYLTLANNTTGNSNVAFGQLNMTANTTGTSNASFGYGALYNNISGGSNMAFGNSALGKNTSGNFNVAVGNAALYENLTGVSNTGIGYWSLRYNTVGNDNVAIGVTALRQNTSGSGNTAVGRESYWTNTTGSNNTVLGYRAGYLSTGSGNVFLGSQAGYTETGSNKLYIANTPTATPLIYGDFTSGALRFAPGYGTGTITGTPAFSLNVDGGGNMIVGPVGGTGGSGGSTLQAAYDASVTAGDNPKIIGGANTLNMSFDGLTNGAGLSVTSTSTAATSQLQRLLNVDLSGTNTTGQNTYAGYFRNTHVDVDGGFNYGIQSSVGGSSSANIAVYGLADGATDIGLYGKSNNGYGVSALTGPGTAVFAQANSGTGLLATSVTGTGAVIGSQNGGIGLDVSAYDNLAGRFVIGSLVVGTIMPVMDITRGAYTSGTNGTGGTVDFKTITTTGTNQLSNQLKWYWTDATDASRTSEFSITGVNNAVTETYANFQKNGIIRINNGADTVATLANVRAGGSSSGGGAGWGLTGNAGTDSSINFIGTTDSVNFNIRTKDSTRLVVKADGSVISPSGALNNGAGTKFIWLPKKFAFRAGSVTTNRWDIDSIGLNSAAFGIDTKATGVRSFAIGAATFATGLATFTQGNSTVASQTNALATGLTTVASGTNSSSFGSNTKSKSYNGMVIGSFNDSTDAASPVGFNAANRIFQIGIGASDATRANAMTVLHSGNVGIGTVDPAANFHILEKSGTSGFLVEGIAINPNIGFKRSNGTSGAPTAMANNDVLGNVRVAGYGATAMGASKSTSTINAADAWTDINQPTYQTWATTVWGGTASSEVMRITRQKNLLVGTTTDDTSAILNVASTTKGLLTPRMNTAQMNAVPTPSNGLLIYQTDSASFFYYSAGVWNNLRGAGGTGTGAIAELIDSPEHIFPTVPVITAGTQPSGATNHTYQWTKMGKQVTLRINLLYATAGATVTIFNMQLPADCPAPFIPTGYVANDYVIPVTSNVGASPSSSPNVVSRGALRATTPRTIVCTCTSGGYASFSVLVTYFTL